VPTNIKTDYHIIFVVTLKREGEAFIVVKVRIVAHTPCVGTVGALFHFVMHSYIKKSTKKIGMTFAKKGHIECQKFDEKEMNQRFAKTLETL
jgi:hypothetical protein